MHRSGLSAAALVAVSTVFVPAAVATQSAAAAPPSAVQTAGLGDQQIAGLLRDADTTEIDRIVGSVTSEQLGRALALLPSIDVGRVLDDALTLDVGDLVAALDADGLVDSLSSLTPDTLATVLGLVNGVDLEDVLDSLDTSHLLAAVSGMTDATLAQLQGELSTLLNTVGVGDGALATAQALVSKALAPTATAPSPTPSTAPSAPPAAAPAVQPAASASVHATATARRSPATITARRAGSRAVRATVRCPAATTCRVQAYGRLAGRRALTARTIGVPAHATRSLTLRLTVASARRLAAHGGTLRVFAKTAGVSAPATAEVTA